MEFLVFVGSLRLVVALFLAVGYWLRGLFVKNRPDTFKEDVVEASWGYAIVIIILGFMLFLFGAWLFIISIFFSILR